MPLESHEITLPSGGVISVACTGRAEGDLHIDGPPAELSARRRAIVDRPWIWLRQVHGATVVDGDDATAVGAEADAVVATSADRVLAVHTADCVPLALVAPDGRNGPVIAAVHAGWRGLSAGVIEATIAAMRSRGAGAVGVYVGPCISVGAYEFGPKDLDLVADRYGDQVRGTTDTGQPALDLRAGVRAAVEQGGGDVVWVSDRCTAAESDALYSHRARQDGGRQALLVWIDDGRSR